MCPSYGDFVSLVNSTLLDPLWKLSSPNLSLWSNKIKAIDSCFVGPVLYIREAERTKNEGGETSKQKGGKSRHIEDPLHEEHINYSYYS